MNNDVAQMLSQTQLQWCRQHIAAFTYIEKSWGQPLEESRRVIREHRERMKSNEQSERELCL